MLCQGFTNDKKETNFAGNKRTGSSTGAPYVVRPARPRSYLDFEKIEAAAAAAERRHYKGLIWLGRARRAGGAPA